MTLSDLQVTRIRRVKRDGSIWDVTLEPGFNLLIGPANASKTTTLEIIDFCLGSKRSAKVKFGSSIADEYEMFELSISIHGTPHNLVRYVHTYGKTTRTEIDGQIYPPETFSNWMYSMLSWPEVVAPRGVSEYSRAGEEVTSFRMLLRHLYRDAESWTSFANKEQPQHRRAVIAFLLGIAEDLFRARQAQVSELSGILGDLSKQRTELRTMLSEILSTVTEGYRRMGVSTLDNLDEVTSELDADVERISSQREQLATTIRSRPDYEQEHDTTLARLDQEINALRNNVASLETSIRDQRRLIDTLAGDIQRLERAQDAKDLLGVMRVTSCPACLQPIVPSKPQSNGEHCYVCSQQVSPDTNRRRLELERRVVESERQELGNAVADLEQRLAIYSQQLESTQAERATLLTRMDSERRALIAPSLAEFERLQFALGQAVERRESVQRLKSLEHYVAEVDLQIADIDQRITDVYEHASEQEFSSASIRSTCDRMASLMNDFIGSLPRQSERFGIISIDPQSLVFQVGGDEWDVVLGNERRVPFLLAYHYASLRMKAENGIPHPGIVIMDNPFQQDVPADIVTSCLRRIAELCDEHPSLQVIVATRRELDDLNAHRVRFDAQFNP